MSEASYIRKSSSLPLASGRNRGAVRFDPATGTARVSTGSTWPSVHEFDVTFNAVINSQTVDAPFYIATRAVQVVAISEVHAVAGNDSGAVTLDITKCTGTQAPSAGTSVLASTLNMKGTANTVQTGSLSATTANLQLATGNRLAANFTGDTATLSGLSVTVTLRYI